MNRSQAQDVVAEVLSQIAPNIDLQRLDRTQDMRRSLDLDSVDFLTVMQRLAQRTGIDIPEADYGQVATFDGLVAYVADRLQG